MDFQNIFINRLSEKAALRRIVTVSRFDYIKRIFSKSQIVISILKEQLPFVSISKFI